MTRWSPRTGATKTDSDEYRSRDRRSGWVRGVSLHESRSWGMGQSAGRYRGVESKASGPGLLSHVRARATREDRGAVVRRRTAPELDRLRRSDDTSPTVKSSTGNRPSRAFLTVRQETVPNVKLRLHTRRRFLRVGRGQGVATDRGFFSFQAPKSQESIPWGERGFLWKLCQGGSPGHTPTSGPFGGMYRRHLSFQRLSLIG